MQEKTSDPEHPVIKVKVALLLQAQEVCYVKLAMFQVPSTILYSIELYSKVAQKVKSKPQ